MRKVPKLRFKEFSDELNNYHFIDIGKVKIGLTHTPKYVEKGIPFLSSKNISKGYIDFDEVQYISKEEFESMPKSTKPQKGDILFTRVGSNLGNPIVLEEEKEVGIFVSLGAIKGNKNFNNFYIKYWIDTNYFWKQVEMKVAGGAKNNLNTTWLNEFKLSTPSLQEQEKIANFLSSVDKKISLTEEKLELFREYKKGVIQKIFSQELRFKDSNGNDYPEWEEKKLGEIAFFSKGKLISKEDITEEGVECIRYGELYTIYKEKIEKVVSKTKLEKNKLILSEKNDVIIPSSGETAIDIAVASCVMKDGVALGADLNIIKTKENGLYLAYFINNPAKLELASLAQGASVIHLYEKHLKLLNIKIPTLEEQQKIADFLSSIDSKIENMEKELEGLKEFKKGLLQQMFV